MTACSCTTKPAPKPKLTIEAAPYGGFVIWDSLGAYDVTHDRRMVCLLFAGGLTDALDYISARMLEGSA